MGNLFSKVEVCFSLGKHSILNQLLQVDKRDAPLAVHITGANQHDKTAAVNVIISVVERPDQEQHQRADMAYDAADFREFLVLEGITPHVEHNPGGSEVQNPDPSHAELGKSANPARRWLVERTLSWLTKRRSIRARRVAPSWGRSFSSLAPTTCSA